MTIYFEFDNTIIGKFKFALVYWQFGNKIIGILTCNISVNNDWFYKIRGILIDILEGYIRGILIDILEGYITGQYIWKNHWFYQIIGILTSKFPMILSNLQWFYWPLKSLESSAVYWPPKKLLIY